jgi:Undecaprenyl-phosphate glucose phosphotransferase
MSLNSPTENTRTQSAISIGLLHKIEEPAIPLAKVRLSYVVAKIVLAEFIAVVSAAISASVFYHYTALGALPLAWQYVPAALYIACLILAVSLGFRHYNALQSQARLTFLWNGLAAVALAFSLFLSTMYLLKIAEGYSRGSFLVQIVAVGLAVLVVRAMAHTWIQSMIAASRMEAGRVVLIGNYRDCAQFAERLRGTGIQSVASLSLPLSHANAIVRRLVESCRAIHPDDIVILMGQDRLAETPELVRSLSELPVRVHIVPLDAVNLLATARLADLGNVLTFEVSRPPLSLFDRVIKRIFDIVVSTLGLIALSPLYLSVAIAIKLDSRGPVFFRQTRHGYNNTRIRVFKFRTMTIMEDGPSVIQASRNDPRVTRVGRILRRTNIDELPQLFNVLTGTMSVVGPRPHATAHNDTFAEKIAPFSRRHSMKPGMTGWAQVNGARGSTDTLSKMQRRVEYDLYYIDNWSFILDVKIVLMTLFSKKGYIDAY